MGLPWMHIQHGRVYSNSWCDPFNPPLYGLSSQCDVHKFIKLESVDTLDANGRSALFYAIAKYNPSIIQVTCKRGGKFESAR